MLQIEIPKREVFDEETDTFHLIEGATLKLEHSLISISKWEAKWCKPFLDSKEKTIEETIDYIRCMSVIPNTDPAVFNNLTTDNINEVSRYIDAPMTATTFNNVFDEKPSREIITSEIIYYWMIFNNVPMECQKWHLNRLLTLIKVCVKKNSPGKKIPKNTLLAKQAELNAMRRASLNTKG